MEEIALFAWGNGKTPLEDVGGEGGYAAFLETIADPDNPDREHMLEWARWQGYKEFDIRTGC
ncbi:hypothetical protein D1970_18240 [Mesobacillus zeae]|uniref:Plasmid pRiA4b Orf3-like domain-containing protein n=1 Tax=Mesobacillus zeae TaxID=1917180 RepID=A0A398B4P8_9BACI|nr:hypothetical protein [Mesobacillus zeae]RID82673.1 hypothetical protein D1970_18240 [Mesobacillus zeae]